MALSDDGCNVDNASLMRDAMIKGQAAGAARPLPL